MFEGRNLPRQRGRPSSFSARGFSLREFLLRQSGIPHAWISLPRALLTEACRETPRARGGYRSLLESPAEVRTAGNRTNNVSDEVLLGREPCACPSEEGGGGGKRWEAEAGLRGTRCAPWNQGEARISSRLGRERGSVRRMQLMRS